MDFREQLDQLWDDELTQIRYGFFNPDADKKIRNVLSFEPDFSDQIPADLVRLLWSIPYFMELQAHRVAQRSPQHSKLYQHLLNWVAERNYDMFGGP